MRFAAQYDMRLHTPILLKSASSTRCWRCRPWPAPRRLRAGRSWWRRIRHPHPPATAAPVRAIAVDLGHGDAAGGGADGAAHRSAQHEHFIGAVARGADFPCHVEGIGDDGQPALPVRRPARWWCCRHPEQGLAAGGQAGGKACDGALVLHAGMHAFGDGRLAVHRHRAAMHTAQFSQRFQLEQVAPDGFPGDPNSPTMRSVETCCNVDSSARIR